MRSFFSRVFLRAVIFSGAWAVSVNARPAQKIYFESAGHRIQIDRLQGAEDSHNSAILVLHGAGGILFDGPEMRRVARRLTADGHPTYLVHYFQRTGTWFGLDAGMQKNFEAWLQTVRDAIGAVQRDQGNARPVGIFGYSLGGFLAVAVASDNPKVGATAEHAGGIWNGKLERVDRMPPVLMLHGLRDRRVPFKKYAVPLLARLRERGSPVETKFFPNEGHVFAATTRAEVREDASKFFRRRNLPLEKLRGE